MKISKNYSKPHVVIIGGATATGKTSLSIKIANDVISSGYKACIINFDSMLFYNELNIGTAKPSTDELQSVPHYLINIGSAKIPINSADFRKKAIKVIEKVYKDTLIVLVGGSAFYIRALIKGMYDNSDSLIPMPESITTSTSNVMNRDNLIDYLKTNDPNTLNFVHANDLYRLNRAYEFHKKTGKMFSEQKVLQEKKFPYNFSKNNSVDWELKIIYLEIEKNQHWKIIKLRTENMISEGLINEVQNLLDSCYDGTEKTLQSIGYKQVVNFLKENKLSEKKELEQLIEQIYIATRRLAKSQKTFFNKIAPKTTMNALDIPNNFLRQERGELFI